MYQWIIAALLASSHPYYVSMTEIEYNKANETLEISVRIFTQDFEKAIRKTYGGKVDLLDTSEKANSDKFIQQYITKHFNLTVNGKNLNINFIGFEAEEGSIWSYFECRNIYSLETLEVNNTILYDYKEQEVNFIHVKTKNSDETVRLNYPDSYKKFKFELR